MIQGTFTSTIYLLWFLVDFLLLTDVNELIDSECSECMISSNLNIFNRFTHSHPSKGENYDTNHSKCKVQVQTSLVPVGDINDDAVFNLGLIPSKISNTKPLLQSNVNLVLD